MQLMGCDMKTPAYRKKKVQEMLDYLKEIGLSVYGPVFKDGVEYPALMDYDADEGAFSAKSWKVVYAHL